VRQAAAEALGQIGAGAATPEVLTALFALLRDAERIVRQAAAEALGNLSVYVGAQQRSEATKLFLRLTRSRNAEQRDTGYVCLRNVLAAAPS
jgi:HEAT repeat protein